jgi:glutamate dehydrogenase
VAATRFEAGTEAYKLFIRTLLSVTDNIVGDAIVPPANTVRHDGDDPYLVVAADKGTATFSDTANASPRRMASGSATPFASGGSARVMTTRRWASPRAAPGRRSNAISARWMSTSRRALHRCRGGRHVRRCVRQWHAAVAGRSSCSRPSITATSSSIPILIATSFAERKRLFDLGRSSWQDYDKSKLSKGGGSSRARSNRSRCRRRQPPVIGSAGKATPQDIMTAILNGGRPALVRRHRHLYQATPAKTMPMSVTAPMTPFASRPTGLRAKVIGEGANLGVTQKGAHCLCAEWRALQFGRHRQFRRRQLLRRRGQHQDRAGQRHARKPPDPAQAQYASGRHDR